MHLVGQMEEAESVHVQARALALEARDLDLLIWGDCWRALSYLGQGNLRTAEKSLATALNKCSGLSTLFRLQPSTKAAVELGIIFINILKGRPGAIQSYSSFLSTLKQKRIELLLSATNLYAGYLELHNGHLDVAQHFFEQVQESDDEDNFWRWRRSILLADLADEQGDHGRSNALRAQLLQLTEVSPDLTIKAFLAAYLAKEGEVERARELIAPLLKRAAKYTNLLLLLPLHYLAGMVELTDRKFDKAGDYFRETIEACISSGDSVIHARSYRALGEIAVVQGDLLSAKKNFETTTELCKIIDLPRERLYFDFACHIPPKTFDGWNLYQEGHVMFSHFGDNT